MEEILACKRLDLVVYPVKQCGITLWNCRSYSILAAQWRNTYNITGIFDSIRYYFGVIISPRYTGTVLERSLCGCICVKLLKLDIGIVLFKIGLCSGTWYNDDLIVCAYLRQIGDHVTFGRYNTQSYIHVRKRKVYFLCSLFCYGKVCKYYIYLTGLKILNSACCLGWYIIDVYSQILSDPLCEIYIVSLILTVLIYISERILVWEYTDVYAACGLDLIKCSVHLVCGFCTWCVCLINYAASVSASAKTCDRQSGC